MNATAQAYPRGDAHEGPDDDDPPDFEPEDPPFGEEPSLPHDAVHPRTADALQWAVAAIGRIPKDVNQATYESIIDDHAKRTGMRCPDSDHVWHVIKAIYRAAVDRFPNGNRKNFEDGITHRAWEGFHDSRQPEPEPPGPAIISFGKMAKAFPKLRPYVLDGMLRRGETMNIVAATKVGKSWLANDLALSVATNRQWLGKFPVTSGRVLLLDNELHKETIVHRIQKVAEARGIFPGEYAESLDVVSLRGCLADYVALDPLFASIAQAGYVLIIFDAHYRFLPPGTEENVNDHITAVYNRLDHVADKCGASLVLIHHPSKGDQSQKSVTDMGAGAGAQSRAADVHMALREHEEPGAAIVEAAIRSSKPMDPFVLKFDFPTWNVANLDVTKFKQRGKKTEKEKVKEWTVQEFVSSFITANPETKDAIIGKAKAEGLSKASVVSFLPMAVGAGLAFRWTIKPSNAAYYATEKQPV